MNDSIVMAPVYSARANVARALCLLSYLSLLSLLAFFNAIAEKGDVLRWVIQSLPLLIFIPGFFRQHIRTYSWLCFVILLYFMVAVTNVMSPMGHWADAVQVILCVTLFISSMLASRWMQGHSPKDHNINQEG